jgi:Mg/Co/Ni transporter MgtE
MSTDELVDLMQLLPSIEAQEIINQLPASSKQQKIQKILQYDEDTAGGLMTTDYITTQLENTVEQAKQKIKEISDLHRFIHYVYVLNNDKKFQGVISLRTLIISDPLTSMADLISKDKKLKTVHVDDSLTHIAKLMTKYNLVSVAVLDQDEKMVGIITVDDIMRRFVPNA